jgi:hypothetical protein
MKSCYMGLGLRHNYDIIDIDAAGSVETKWITLAMSMGYGFADTGRGSVKRMVFVMAFPYCFY